MTEKKKKSKKQNQSALIIAHGTLAQTMLDALIYITGPQPGFHALALDHALDVDKARDIIISAIDDMMDGSGVLVLTDLFGGTPTNLAISIMDEKFIEIVAGVNLPMLIHAVTLDSSLALKEKAKRLREYGRDNIFIASEVLSGNKK